MEFDVEEIEDIKTAVAEACIMLMSQAHAIREIALDFEISDDIFSMDARASGPFIPKNIHEQDKDSELSRYLLQALMDNAKVQSEGGFIRSIHIDKGIAL